ncbi:MAG TPA: sel1 repeat family protein [Gammaproteobacteria bacterium]|nr:sel1 repeat family protein [Gammaproteobacteria bacterium]
MKTSRLARTLCCLVLVLGMRPVWSANDTPVELQMIAHEALDGDPGAQLLYGLAYLNGREGLKPDAKKAVYWLRRSARIGNAYAQLTLGNCYAEGRGVEKDPQQAVLWWHKAAEKDNPKAQYRVGKAHLEGDGVSKNPERAVYWITRSAEQGNKDAQYLLGKMYYEGYNVPYEKEAARSWLSRAAGQAHSGAINLLAVINGMVDTTTKVYQQSAKVLADKAEKGDPQAEYELGLRYESGAWDVNRDNKKALLWITKAANAGNRIAMKTLADIYQHGDLGLQADPGKAAEWEKRASQRPPAQ